ncbi:hypothetical protein Ocin01_11523 [Orchesella cincta]|uniref:Transmembrane protein n=1 Tax=Orchesella cincta TaxID=48709 RepID=A0A1D2MQL1_ORCCI|nr:hypothetical protein Ocin01_11523 [Orchesella cincta]
MVWVIDALGTIAFLTELIILLVGGRSATIEIVRVVLALIFELVFVWLATQLYQATTTRDQRACRSWLMWTGGLVILLICGMIAYTSIQGFATDFIVILLIIAFKFYESLVVNAYRQQVMREGGATGEQGANAAVPT